MGIFSNRVTSRLGLVFSVAVLGALGPAELHSSNGGVIDEQSYVLVTSDTVRTSQLVEAVGGDVVSSTAAVNTVGATLTIEQAELISRSALIQRISEQSEEDSAEELQVAGWWWGN